MNIKSIYLNKMRLKRELFFVDQVFQDVYRFDTAID